MNIGLMAVDSNYPNLALMKISNYHKTMGDYVEWYNHFENYDILYMSKIFNFTHDYPYVINNAKNIIKGGTGYNIHSSLPKEIEYVKPDYSIYPSIDNKTAYGFLTRGCPNKCKWCIVPKKEGAIKPYMDIEDIAINGRTNLILMDNNVLAIDYGLEQIKKIIEKGYKVDFNQALDARLITDNVAKLLGNVRWINNLIRLGCDTTKQIEQCEKAMSLIDNYRGKPAYYLMYTIIGSDLNESVYRVSYWKKYSKVRVVAQPFRDVSKINTIPLWQKDLARWSMRREIYAKCDFKDYEPRKGFRCVEYLKH